MLKGKLKEGKNFNMWATHLVGSSELNYNFWRIYMYNEQEERFLNFRLKCSICNINFQNEIEYMSHLKVSHVEKYNDLLDSLLDLDGTGYILANNREMKNRDDFCAVKEGSISYASKGFNEIKYWEPTNFNIEATTIWSFPWRGDWATHNPSYRGNWTPYIPRNIILRYSEVGDYVLDQFLGGGTTLIETKLLNRRGIGVDINNKALEIAKKNLDFRRDNCFEPKIVQGNAIDLNFIKDKSIDLICTHPPYANIIKYSEDIPGDLSLCDLDEFLKQMKKVAQECYRVLKPNKYCSILMGDTRREKHVIPLGFKVMQLFLDAGFILKEIVIKEQHNCKATEFWYQKSIDFNFLLIAHEYLFIFRKP